jgi:hypothetical protein
MTVAEYSRQFFDRVLRKSYGPTEEDNAVVAGQKFCSECHPHHTWEEGCFTLTLTRLTLTLTECSQKGFTLARPYRQISVCRALSSVVVDGV